jgi:rhodanese-related sulfurtransferase
MSVIQISPQDAFNSLKSDNNCVLIDVRTFEEFALVGIVDDSAFKDRMVLLPWQLAPQMSINPDFASDLKKFLQRIFQNFAADKIRIIFICRSGARSNSAANYALSLGYKNCYNVTSGFEGDVDHNYQRGKINGWKAENLPWRQN